jgi:hypothetical protein
MAQSYSWIPDKNKLPKRRASDFYETPNEVADLAIRLLDIKPSVYPYWVLDPGAGTGVYGQAFRRRYCNTITYGVDIRDIPRPEGYTIWQRGDFAGRTPFNGLAFDYIIGNPPFSRAMQFMINGWRLLKDGGQMIYLFPADYVSSAERYVNIFTQIPPKQVVSIVQRVSFDGSGSTNQINYCYYLWEKGWTGSTELKWLPYRHVDEERKVFLTSEERYVCECPKCLNLPSSVQLPLLTLTKTV